MAFWFEQLQAAQACEADKNPIVGDPAQIAGLAKQLTGTADSLRTQAERLRAVSTEKFWKGEAATEFLKLKEKLPPLLDKVVKRYAAVGDALAKYSPDLQESQESAQRALQAYRDAKAQQQSAQANVQQYNQLQLQARQQNRQLIWNGQHPSGQMDHANQAVSNAIRMMANAIDTRNATASTCANRINDAIDDDLKNDDSFWGKLKRIGKKIVEALEKIAPVLRKIATVLGVAAALLAWVPVLGEILIAAAVVVSAVTLAVDLILKASGKNVSWKDIAMDAIGIIPIGKAARLAKGAKPASWFGAIKGVLKGDKAAIGGLVNYGKEIVKNIGPAYKAIGTATMDVLKGRATAGTIFQGAKTAYESLGGIKGVVKDIGIPGIVLSAKKIYGLFTDGNGASTTATAPANPATFTSGLPVGSTSSTPSYLTASRVDLPVAA